MKDVAQRAGGRRDRRDPACFERGGRPSPWLVELLKRKSPKLVAVALANKMARIAWKLMVTRRKSTTQNPRRRVGERGLEIGRTRGATQLQPC